MRKSYRIILTILLFAWIIVFVWGLIFAPSPFVSPISPLSSFSAHETSLINPSFEGQYHIQDGVGEVNVPDGWRAWYVDSPWCKPLKPGCDIPCPSNCLQAQPIYSSDGTATISETEPGKLVAWMDVITPVETIEARLFYPATAFSFTVFGAGEAQVFSEPGAIHYSIESQSPMSGQVKLFDAFFEQTQDVTVPVKLELDYFAGRPSGGEYHGGEYVAYKADRVTATLSLASPRCSTDYGCYWARPEFVPITTEQAAYRVRSGERSQKYFSYGRMHEAGMLQQVSATPGKRYEFGAWMQSWQCYDWESCCHHRPSCISDKPYSMGLRVGIDPLGWTDPLADTVVWSPPGESFDAWSRFAVVAQARAITITVFTRSSARFDWARTNNDVYLDDAIIVEVLPIFFPAVMR